jgi:hypothetical protein
MASSFFDVVNHSREILISQSGGWFVGRFTFKRARAVQGASPSLKQRMDGLGEVLAVGDLEVAKFTKFTQAPPPLQHFQHCLFFGIGPGIFRVTIEQATKAIPENANIVVGGFLGSRKVFGGRGLLFDIVPGGTFGCRFVGSILGLLGRIILAECRFFGLIPIFLEVEQLPDRTAMAFSACAAEIFANLASPLVVTDATPSLLHTASKVIHAILTWSGASQILDPMICW